MLKLRIPSLVPPPAFAVVVVAIFTYVRLVPAAVIQTSIDHALSFTDHPRANKSFATFGNSSVPSITDPAVFEWTALGDSYASGVGTTNYIDGLRCLRYDQAYPILLSNAKLSVQGHSTQQTQKLNNVVCSGAEIKDIMSWQLLDTSTWGKPDMTYGNRPAFGSPEFATLTAGGDDIDFPGILFNCILGVHVKGGPTKRTCTDQQTYTWSLLNNGQYKQDLVQLIAAIMQKGRSGPAGSNFKLYVTGYGRFFNADTTGNETNCDSTTFVGVTREATRNTADLDKKQIDGLIRGRSLGPRGASDARLTQNLRQSFNNMADSLNSGVQEAVARSNDPGVKFIDIQTDASGNDILGGHRFCETGIQEPNRSNANLFFWHYPYAGTGSAMDDTMTSKAEDAFDTAYTQVFNDAGDDINTVYPKYNQFLNPVLKQFMAQMNQTGADDVRSWASILGDRTRVFHPQLNWHQIISSIIFEQYAADIAAGTTSTSTSSSTTSSSTMSTTPLSTSSTIIVSSQSLPSSPTSVSAPAPSPSDTCGDWYKFFFDHFEIYGQNFNVTEFGTDGSGLEKQIKGCGDLTRWKFTYLQNDPQGMQWYASGNLPIGTKACVGRAVVSAGGSGPSGCTGSG